MTEIDMNVQNLAELTHGELALVSQLDFFNGDLQNTENNRCYSATILRKNAHGTQLSHLYQIVLIDSQNGIRTRLSEYATIDDTYNTLFALCQFALSLEL